MKLLALMKKEFLRFFRDPRLIFTMLLPGILICLIWFVFMTYVSIRRLIPAFYGAYGTGIT